MKKNMFKINNSNFLKVCLLVIFASMQPLANANAQSVAKDSLYYKLSGVSVEVGDSVMINRDSLYYHTGERKSTWVYDKVHTVMQVGGKRHPDAILLKEIYSWVEIGSIEPMNKVKRELVYEELEAKRIAETQPLVELTPAPEPLPEPEPVLEPQPLVEDTIDVVEDTVDVVEDTVEVLEDTIPESPLSNRLGIGLRAGFASTMTNINGLPLGFDVLFDIRYAHYWKLSSNQLRLGIMTGLSAGYVQANQQTALVDKFTLATDEGDVDYSVSADEVKEKTHQVQLELPVMFAMLTSKGFFLNVGPKFILPVYSTFHQTITNPNIYAYVSELNGEPIINEVVTGKVTSEQCDLVGSFNNELKLAIAAGLELGYEFKFDNGHSLDLGVYADYTVYSMYSKYGNSRVITITPPSASSSAIVDVKSLSQAYANKFKLLDVGIKLTYNIDFIK